MDSSQLVSDSNPSCVPGIYILKPVPRNMTITPCPNLDGMHSQPHNIASSSPVALVHLDLDGSITHCKTLPSLSTALASLQPPEFDMPPYPRQPSENADHHPAQHTASVFGDSDLLFPGFEGHRRGDAEPVPGQMPTASPHSAMTTPGLPGHAYASWQIAEYSEQTLFRRNGEQNLQDPVIPNGPQSQTREKPRVHAVPAHQVAGVERPTKRKRGMNTPLVLGRTEANNDNLDGERVTLGAECEEDARFIFDARESLPNMRGRGMWDEISRRYETKYGIRLRNATLQMKLSRAVARYVIWPKSEVEKLKEAYFHVQQQKNTNIRKRMLETGGGRLLGLTIPLPAIEAKLVELGYEEANEDRRPAVDSSPELDVDGSAD